VAPFSDKQIELLQTFADQAVIAIENVRLFNETKEALDRQTATSEILRVVSQSHTEVRTVFDAIADNAMRLLRASAVSVYRVEDDGFKTAAVRGGLPGSDQAVLRHASWPMDRETPAGRCMVDRTPVHISDIKSDPIGAQMAGEGQTLRDFAHSRGWRSSLVVPILDDNGPIGAISVARAETGSFTSAEIELLQTFADQARIAIENARLLSELQARTRQLTVGRAAHRASRNRPRGKLFTGSRDRTEHDRRAGGPTRRGALGDDLGV
jgi:GAF domain-containing protein